MSPQKAEIIELTPVHGSALIAADGWSRDGSILRIQFQGGKTYTYTGLTPEVRKAYESAPSKGKYFSQHIKTNI